MKKLGLVLLCLAVCTTWVFADGITRDLTPVRDGLTLPSLGQRGDCELGLSVIGAAYYFSWDPGEGIKLYVDPAIDQTWGECLPPYYPMTVNSVAFYFYLYADSLSTVGYTACFEIDVECPKNICRNYPDKCNGPGDAICAQQYCYTFTADDWVAGMVGLNAPFVDPCCVAEPFFFGVTLISWDGPAGLCPGVLSEELPVANQDCRVWSHFYGGAPLGLCWFNVSSDYVTPWGPWLLWAEVTSEVACEPVVCVPCPHLYPGDDLTCPILVNTAPWTQTIDLCQYCPDYDKRVEYPGGSFSGAGPDVVLKLDFPPELPQVCFTITLTPQCASPTFFRLRSWIADQYGVFYDGNPANPGAMVAQTYDFTPAGLGCLPNATYWLYIDTRNDACCCPVIVTYTGDTPLPVELKSFEAVSGDRMVTLNWTTATELNNEYFEVQRSTAASDWTMIGQVYGAGTSVTEHSYTYVDRAVVNSVTYTYRLLSHDINGEVHEYAKTEEATPGVPMPTEYALSQNFPNPFNPNTSISFSVKEAGFVSLKVYNLIGQEVATLVAREMPAGNYPVSFTATDLPSGVYVYRLEVNDFTAQKKMVLLK